MSSALLSPIFTSASVAETFSDRAVLQAMLDFEAALAEAEEELGVTPARSAGPIAAACKADLYDIAALGKEAALAGNVAIPLVKALTAKVREPARFYVHWGATSQDVIDTAFMLCVRAALKVMRADLREAIEAAIALVSAHRQTIMPGRTLMQQAVPISFAFKAAGWLSGLTGAAERLRWVAANAVVFQFGGAAGTLAALGEHGLQVRTALARRLELAEPDITWHTQRSRILDFSSALANVSVACAKIATDILLLMQSEVAEAHEPAAAGKGGSSTMPQKRNPVGAIAIRANHRRIAGFLATIVASLEQEHERGAGGWAAEWETLRDLCCLAAGSLEKLRDMLKGLEIDAARMRENLDATLGLTLAESLTMALAGKIGLPEAQHRVAAISKLALARKVSLAEVARTEPAVAGNLSADEIDRALDPSRYLGSADAMIDAALAAAAREMERD